MLQYPQHLLTASHLILPLHCSNGPINLGQKGLLAEIFSSIYSEPYPVSYSALLKHTKAEEKQSHRTANTGGGQKQNHCQSHQPNIGLIEDTESKSSAW